MRLSLKVKIPPSKCITLNCPNLTEQLLVPQKLIFTEGSGDTEVPAKDIQCKITGSGSELLNHTEAYFFITNEVPLDTCSTTIERSGRVEALLTNRSQNLKIITMYVDYSESIGNIIYQEKTDRFEELLRNISKAGRPTRLVFGFNRPVKGILCSTTVDATNGDDDNWIQPFKIEPEESESGCGPFALDCANEKYGKFLEYMQLSAQPVTINEQQPLQIYVLAYGFQK